LMLSILTAYIINKKILILFIIEKNHKESKI
jgi:hypothetical protein